MVMSLKFWKHSTLIHIRSLSSYKPTDFLITALQHLLTKFTPLPRRCPAFFHCITSKMSEPNKDEASVTIQEPVAPPPPTLTEDNNVEVKSGMSTWKIVAISASVVTVVGLALGLGLGLGLKSDDPGILSILLYSLNNFNSDNDCNFHYYK